MWMINTEWHRELAGKYALAAYDRGDKDLERWETTLVEIPEKDLYQLATGLQNACDQLEYYLEQIKKLQQELADPESVEAMTHALELHHKSVVRPVTEYCNAFDDWIKACIEAHEEYDKLPEKEKAHRGKPPLYDIKDYLWKLRSLDIGKSDYLRRRIYAKEAHRTEQCPIHKGHWSGIVWPGTVIEGCKCMDDDGNVSGWIKVDE